MEEPQSAEPEWGSTGRSHRVRSRSYKINNTTPTVAEDIGEVITSQGPPGAGKTRSVSAGAEMDIHLRNQPAFRCLSTLLHFFSSRIRAVEDDPYYGKGGN